MQSEDRARDTPTSPPLPLRLVRRGGCEFLEPAPEATEGNMGTFWLLLNSCGRVKWNGVNYYRSAEDRW